MHKRIFETTAPTVVEDMIKVFNVDVTFRPVRTGEPNTYVIEGDDKHVSFINKVVDVFDTSEGEE